ncbi:MAG: hypothetical protein JO347_02055, partial [Candidatus Eremiobacteraeota bacterium]|nr:hypothetical protein [Candidatus Eremiobacteraeota bacterium]
MQYKEILRARNALMWYVLTWAVVAVFVVIVNASAHGHAHVTVSDLPKDAPKIDHVPWMVFYILAAWSGA